MLILLALTAVAGRGEELPPPLKVPHFPEAVYLGEKMTFVVEAETGAEVCVEFDGVQVEKMVFPDKERELDLVLDKPGLLVFRHGSAAVSFHLVAPSDNVLLREELGFLYSDRGPVILMARHLHPPKHDRRLETWRFLKGLFSDARPDVSSGVVLCETSLLIDGSGLPTAQSVGTGSNFWTHVPVPERLSEINGFITGSDTLKQADVLVLALSARDMEQGMSALEFRVKLEWCLQFFDRFKFAHMFVALPALRSDQQERFAGALESLTSAALGNRAVYLGEVARRKDARESVPREWLKAVEQQISRTLKYRDSG